MFALTIVFAELREKLRRGEAEWPTRREWAFVVSLDLLNFTAGFIVGGVV